MDGDTAERSLQRIVDVLEQTLFRYDLDTGEEAEGSIADSLARIADALEKCASSLSEINLAVGGPWPGVLADALAERGVGQKGEHLDD